MTIHSLNFLPYYFVPSNQMNLRLYKSSNFSTLQGLDPGISRDLKGLREVSGMDVGMEEVRVRLVEGRGKGWRLVEVR